MTCRIQELSCPRTYCNSVLILTPTLNRFMILLSILLTCNITSLLWCYFLSCISWLFPWIIEPRLQPPGQSIIILPSSLKVTVEKKSVFMYIFSQLTHFTLSCLLLNYSMVGFMPSANVLNIQYLSFFFLSLSLFKLMTSSLNSSFLASSIILLML